MSLLSLHEYMLNLKSFHRCSLEFQINQNNDIAIGARKSDKLLFDVIVVSKQIDLTGKIEESKGQSSKSHIARCVSLKSESKEQEDEEKSFSLSDTLFFWKDEDEDEEEQV